MNNKKNYISYIMFFILLLVVSTSMSFAYFTAHAEGESETTVVTQGGSLTIDYDGGPNISFSGIYPKHEPWAVKEFTVTGKNTTDLNMDYNINLIIEENTFTNNSLYYKLEGISNDGNGTLIEDSNDVFIKDGSSNTKLGVGSFSSPTGGSKVHKYVLNIYFPESGIAGAENENQGKSFSAYIKIENE